MNNSVDKYAAPQLTVYGSMVKLTASGAGASCENGTTNSQCSPALPAGPTNPNKRP